MSSKFLSLNLQDLLKGAGLAVAGAIFAAVKPMVMTFVSTGTIPAFSIATAESIIYTGLAAGFAYLGKNFFTNSSGDVFAKEVPNGYNNAAVTKA